MDLLADQDAYEAKGVAPKFARDWAAYDLLVLETMQRINEGEAV
jgi:hypothetical protein